MTPADWLKEVAYVAKPPKGLGDDAPQAYYSKFDDSYITFVGLEEDIRFLADRDITEELTHGVGFSPRLGKWYGWSHRAIYGFKVGSSCKRGDCHYRGFDEEDQKEDAIRFWSEDYHENVRCEGIVERDGARFFDIKWEHTNIVPNKSLRGQIGGVEHYIEPPGKGEWVAHTMDDAKQMAQDFNSGVS